MIHLLPHWNQTTGTVVRVCAPTNCEEAELFLNGTSLGRKTGDCIHTPEWQVPFTPGVLTAIGYRKGKEAALDEIRTAGTPCAILAKADRTTPDNTGKDAVTVDISIVDRDGNVVPDADHLLHFTAHDGLRFLGAGNGDPNSLADDAKPEHAAFHGLAQAVVSVACGASSASLTVSAEGLAPATVIFAPKNADEPQAPRAGMNVQIGDFRMTGVTEEKPDPLQYFDVLDVNSLMPVVFDSHYQKDFGNGWRLYRSVFRLPTGQDHFALRLPDTISDEIEIYANGKPIFASRASRREKEVLTCPFDGTGGTDMDLRILIRMQNATQGGIRKGVFLLAAAEI